LTALGDPTRRAIFERLADAGPAAVGAIAGDMPVSRPAVSQHLKVLKQAGLVKDRQAGNRRIYSLDPNGVGELRAYFDRFWTQALGRLQDGCRARSGDLMTTQEAGHVRPHVRDRGCADRRAYGVGVNGGESDWGRVLAFEPPSRLVVSWDINLDWKHELDPDKASEFEVRFVPEAPDRTRVELEHRHLERHGEGWEQMRDSVGSPEGWNGGLQLFAKAAAA